MVKRGPKGADGGGPAWVSAFSAWGIRGLIFDGVRSMMGPRDTLAVGARAGVSGKGSESGKRHHGGSTMGCWEGAGVQFGGSSPFSPFSGIWRTPLPGQELGGFGVIGCHLIEGDLQRGVLGCHLIGGHLGDSS